MANEHEATTVAHTEAPGGAEHQEATAWGLNPGGWVALAMLVVFAIAIWKKVPAAIGKALDKKIAAIRDQLEEAAALLGAGRMATFRRVILPSLVPAILTGFALAFARALGEYGSVVFISGNMPMKTEIAPLLIATKLEQYDYAGATAIATVMLGASFLLLFGINLLQRWARRAEA